VSKTHVVAAVTPVTVDKAGTTAYFNAISTAGPSDQSTADLVAALRSSVIPAAGKGTDMKAYVGGTTAGYVDLASNISATIMVFVFGSFVLNGDPTVKQFGVGLAVAVILDATIVRCLLVPALMVMVGRANWYLPRWVDRVLPHISIEGAEFFAARDRAAAVPQVQYSGSRPS
jgi:hypothetical protein